MNKPYFFARIFLLICVTQLFSQEVSAAPILTELHPAPATNQPEWIELHNPDPEPVDLTGWQLWDELSTPSLLLTLSASLAPQETRVFELPNAKLNNSADGVTLRNPTGQTIDSTSYTNSEPTLSWLRIAQHWQLGAATPGSFQSVAPSPTPQLSPTPPASNSPTPTPTPHPTLVPTPQPSPTPTAHFSLKLTELYPCPPTGEQEYVTITNTGTSPLDLGQLLIRDEQHNTRTTSGTLTPESTTTISWSTAMLNNAGDTVSVVTLSGQVLDSAQYTNCETGMPLVLRSGSWSAAELELPITSSSAPDSPPTPQPDSSATASHSAAMLATTTNTARRAAPPPIPTLLPSDSAHKRTPYSNQTASTIQYLTKEIPLLASMSVILGGVVLSCGGYIVWAAATHQKLTRA